MQLPAGEIEPPFAARQRAGLVVDIARHNLRAAMTGDEAAQIIQCAAVELQHARTEQAACGSAVTIDQAVAVGVQLQIATRLNPACPVVEESAIQLQGAFSTQLPLLVVEGLLMSIDANILSQHHPATAINLAAGEQQIAACNNATAFAAVAVIQFAAPGVDGQRLTRLKQAALVIHAAAFQR
ncbi:hypothetical protein BW31_02002 [Pantoea agglomerans]|nr:hypothetical protein BW31_02002 [Pantoea agglomerans]